MFRIVRHALLSIWLAGVAAWASAADIELTRDNPATLIGTRSSDYSVFGVKLGMTRARAASLLEGHPDLVAVQDDKNPARLYVNKRNATDGAKVRSLLYLIWIPGTDALNQITVFNDAKPSLAGTFRFLLTAAAVDPASGERKRLLGEPNRQAVTLDIESIKYKHTTFFYEDVGLQVTRQQHGATNGVVFAIYRPK